VNSLNVLALDTSSATTFVAVRNSRGQVFQSMSQESANHSEQLAGLVARVLDDAGIKAQELEQLVIGDGPGSFTGLRIGFSFMKGLASSIECPLQPISSLAAAAYEFLEPGKLFVSIADARRDQVFCQLLWKSNSGQVLEHEPATIVDVAQLWSKSEMVARDNGLSDLVTVCVDPDLGFLSGKVVVKPNNIGRSLLEMIRIGDLGIETAPKGSFDVMALAHLEPHYVRAVAAKTIAERLGQ
jgi:tRNA threonylcarbamoyl adenosine modification protein YeaZ